jgi:hypothetical protein
MQPLISLRVGDPRRVWRPGEQLELEYQIDAVAAEEILAVEASVLWYTEGKGDEDLSVLYFERRTANDLAEGGDLRELRKVSVTLPNSPLSYHGAIVKVRWCARVRVFLRGGKESFFECPFQLGAVPAATAMVAAAPARESLAGGETWLVGSESRLAKSEFSDGEASVSRNGKARASRRENGASGAPAEEAETE